MKFSAATTARGGEAAKSASDELALLEFFLTSDDFAACAQRAVDWLGEQGEVEQALCVAIVNDPDRLFGIAGWNVPADQVADYSIGIADATGALGRAIHGEKIILIPDSNGAAPSAFHGKPFHALPLRSQGDERSVGLLLVVANELPKDARWAARVLGEKLARLRSGQVFAEGRFGRERTLASEASLLHSLINAVTDPILLTDPEGKLIIANTRAERLFIAREDDNEGRRRAIALNNMLFSSALAAQEIAHEGGRREVPLVDPSEGFDLLFELLSSTVNDPHTGAPCVVSILRNVTDLGRASEELRENYRKLRIAQAEVRAERHRLDLIIDSVADPILVTDAVGDIVLMNAPAEKLFTVQLGSSREAKARVRANDAHFSSFVSNLLFSGSDRRHRGDIGLVDPASGAILPVEAVTGKILSENGELTAVVTILHDRTEQLEKAKLYEQLRDASKELEQKVQSATGELAHQNELLRRQALQLEQASSMKSQFLANMSHEFRTPLNAILGYTHMLLAGVNGALSPAQRRNLARVDSNSKHLLLIINEILDITRIEAGRMPVNPSEFRLGALVAEVMSELEPIITRSQLTVTTDVDGDVPTLFSDRQKIKQIVLNLLSNALKFTHRGSVTIAARHDRATRIVSIAVTDTGIGIDPKDHARVFEDFQQVDTSTTRQYMGTGLGLSICRRLAEMLGGKITLESAIGKGSTFTLHVPRRTRPRPRR
ncbi:MAG TPA: ATP-binding protein [Planctomycetota bacterium]|nr:ATP-binding protein [Planctomycetota bacterium]